MISKIHMIPIPRKSFKKVKNLNGIVFHWKSLKVDNLCLRLFYHEAIYCTRNMQVQILSFFCLEKRKTISEVFTGYFLYFWVEYLSMFLDLCPVVIPRSLACLSRAHTDLTVKENITVLVMRAAPIGKKNQMLFASISNEEKKSKFIAIWKSKLQVW